MQRSQNNSLVKCFYRATLLSCCLLCIGAFSTPVKAQQVSTVAEVYDYDIGDIFHYLYRQDYGFQPDSIRTEVEITGKYFTTNNDTVVYHRSVVQHDKPYGSSSWTTTNYTDSVYYTNLTDPIIGGFGTITVYDDNVYFNGRQINKHNISITESITMLHYVEGCGSSLNSFVGTGNYTGHFTRLEYYKKGTEIGGNILSTPEQEAGFETLQCSPNPAHQHVNIEMPQLSGAWLTLYTPDGKQLESYQLPADRNTIGIGHLPAGIYILSIQQEDRIAFRRIVKQ